MPLSSEAIATFALEAGTDGLDPAVVERVEQVVLDAVGCSLGAFASPPVKALRATFGDRSGSPEATVLGTDVRLAVEYAALVNGAMVRYLDFNDCYVSGESVCHPSDHVPALVAVAEAAGASGRDLVEAIAVAYEVECRGVDTGAAWEQGFDYVTWGSYSTAAAAGRLLGLSHDELVDALGIAGASSAALLVSRLGDVSMWKGTAHAYASHDAVQACLLAREGMTGPDAVFEGPGGFFEAVARRPLDVTLDPDAERVLRTNLKPYPCGYFMQSALEAALSVVEAHGVDPADIDAVRVETFAQSVQVLGDATKWSTDLTRETADHSLPYALAVALLEGDLRPEHFRPAWLEDARVHALMAAVEVVEDPDLTRYRAEHPGDIPAVVTVEAGGEAHEARVDRPPGHAANPMADERRREKARRLLAPVLGDDQVDRALDACEGLADLESMAPLLEALVV